MQVTLENTKQASVLLIRKLFLLMQNLDALPNKVYLTMKLYYYDDITPADYQPPGFKEGVYDHLWFEGMPVHFKVGEVHTSYHALRVQVSVEQSQVEKLQRRDYLKESKPVSVDEEKKASSKKIDTEGDFPSEDESAQFKKPARPLQKRRAATKTLATKETTSLDHQTSAGVSLAFYCDAYKHSSCQVCSVLALFGKKKKKKT
ncbi:HORMA domain-containing protein 1 [Oryzias melastigma]|uniref:HORMA domain-containing protein 1 n=1 Tax=Oryzias melastigma TaxID=30732 RepID=A0A834C1W1_ORYME|nr:HORMA domain-containing protein 1 [Oryzias melastigma]